MITQSMVDGYVERFEMLTGDEIEDWSSWEDLVARGEQDNPTAMLKCVSDCIVGKLQWHLDTEPVDPFFVRDLAILLGDVSVCYAANASH